MFPKCFNLSIVILRCLSSFCEYRSQNKIVTILITSDRTKNNTYGNVADDNVLNYVYDYYLDNSGTIDVGKLLVDTTVGMVGGAFGGSTLGVVGMGVSGAITGFAGSVAGDIVESGSLYDVKLGAAIISGVLGGLLGVLGGPGAQYGKLGNVMKYTSKLNNVKARNITNKYATHVRKKLIQAKENLIYRRNI